LKRVAAGKGLPKRAALEHNPASREFPKPSRPRQLFFFAMKINIKRLDHVQVCVPRGAEARAREFYGGLLGLEEVEKPEVLRAGGGVWYNVADIQLHVGVEDGNGLPSKRHPAFEVEDIAGARAYLERNGVRTKDEPSIPGARRFSFYDPFGNRIELLEKTKS
jgi:catechol 2,3-dioxygenase-like lactoylglutathione lyase family enzyme